MSRRSMARYLSGMTGALVAGLMLAGCGDRQQRNTEETTSVAATPAPSPGDTAIDTHSTHAPTSPSRTAVPPGGQESTSAKAPATDTAKTPATTKTDTAKPAPSKKDTGKAATPAAAPAAAPAPAADAAGKQAPSGGGANEPITPQMVSDGQKIFTGKEGGGTCYACHGPDAKGTQIAPDLTDATWLNIDGSYASIEQVVTNGVPQPKQHPAPMPPMGGASLKPDQVKAVAAYVYSLSHKT